VLIALFAMSEVFSVVVGTDVGTGVGAVLELVLGYKMTTL